MTHYLKMILLIIIAIAAFLFAENVKKHNRQILKPQVLSSNNFDGNRIDCDMQNNGMFVSHNVSRRSGLSWPKGYGTQTIFASGLWLGGKINGEVRVSAGEYAGELASGPWGSDHDDEKHKIYKVNKTDLQNPEDFDDFQNWPAELGAPWVDNNNNGIYEPLPNGPDHPEFIGDQVLWMVMNDGVADLHTVFQTEPMGFEVQRTIFGFDNDYEYSDMMFIKDLIINKGDDTIGEMYVGLWSDPDLGDASDDFVGCDTILGMGICYNDGDDVVFTNPTQDYWRDITALGMTPAVGYDLFQGPMVPAAGETAYMFGREYPNMKNLKMTSFVKYIGPDPTYYDPNNAVEAYNYMKGLLADGSEFPYIGTGGTKFVHPGDPTKDTGLNDGEWIDAELHPSDDRRMLMNAGPFTFAPGDSQEVVYGIIHAAAGEWDESYLKLKEVDAWAQFAYDNNFELPLAPPKPQVNVTTFAEEIILQWGNASETVIVYGPQFEGELSQYKFEGYNVYQLENENGAGEIIRIATYDIINGVKKVYESVYDENYGENIEAPVQFGTDSGVQRSILIDKDYFKDSRLITNREYYFAVTAYNYNEYGHPKSLETDISIIKIRPQIANEWEATDETAAYGYYLEEAVQTAGQSDGRVYAKVIDPTKLTGDDYEIFFTDEIYTLNNDDGIWYNQGPASKNIIDAGLPRKGALSTLYNSDSTITIFGWYARNLTTNEIVTPHCTIQRGFADDNIVDGVFIPAHEPGWEAYPIAEGLQFIVEGPEPGIKAIEEYGADDDALIDGTVDEHLHPSLSQTGLILSNRANGINLPALARDYDRFDYWGMDNVIIDFSTPSVAWDYIAETVNGIVPFSVYREVFPTMERQRMFAGYWESGGDLSWDIHDPWETPTFYAPSFEPIYCWQGYDVAGNETSYDPANEAQYLADNSLLTSANQTWGGGTGEFHYPYVTATMFGAYYGLNAPGDFTGSPAGSVSALPIAGNYDKTGAQLTQSHYFKFTTAKANTVGGTFLLSTAGLGGIEIDYDPNNIKVWPNPYFGYNPEEAHMFDRQIHFTHLPESGKCIIRIFDLAGTLVRKIVHDNGTQFEIWNLANDKNIYVASGMYIVHIETDEGEKILKLAVIQPS